MSSYFATIRKHSEVCAFVFHTTTARPDPFGDFSKCAPGCIGWSQRCRCGTEASLSVSRKERKKGKHKTKEKGEPAAAMNQLWAYTKRHSRSEDGRLRWRSAWGERGGVKKKKKPSPSVDNGDFNLATQPRSGCIFASAIRASWTHPETDWRDRGARRSFNNSSYTSINLGSMAAWWRRSPISPDLFWVCLCPSLTSITRATPTANGSVLHCAEWKPCTGGHGEKHTCTREQTHTHTICSESGSKQRPASITIYLRSVKFNDLLYPLVPSNELQH